MSRMNDLTGQRFGMLTVTGRSDKKANVKHTYWNCACDCGNLTVVYRGNLKGGRARSCGCFKRPEIINFLKENAPGKSDKELAGLVSTRFGITVTTSRMKHVRCHLRINVHANRNRPEKPLYTETIAKRGFIFIKVPREEKQHNGWIPKHQRIWEQANGHIPPRHLVIFADGNKSNFALNNLLLVTRREFAFMNNSGLLSHNPEITKTAAALAKLNIALSDKKKSIIPNEGGDDGKKDEPKTKL
jgi:hypothetical protein